MNTEDIKIFLEINKSRNISVAARDLFLAQSTVSRRLSSLEQALNVRLFVRGRGTGALRLTRAGERFARLAQQMILLEEEARSLCHRG